MYGFFGKSVGPWTKEQMMGFLSRLFGRKEPPDDAPFMEHPSGQHNSAVDAMEDAIVRLRNLPKWDRWITLCAQGEGHRPESYHFAKLALLGDTIDPAGASIDPQKALEPTGLDKSGISVFRNPDGHLVISNASPNQFAILLNSIFRDQMGIRPHADDDGDDYAIGAEW
jgi:hypothetical protein